MLPPSAEARKGRVNVKSFTAGVHGSLLLPTLEKLNVGSIYPVSGSQT